LKLHERQPWEHTGEGKEGEEERRRHGGGHSEQLAAPRVLSVRGLLLWKEGEEGRRKERRKEKEGKERRKNVEIFSNLKISEK
jgi:hypothetical protein